MIHDPPKLSLILIEWQKKEIQVANCGVGLPLLSLLLGYVEYVNQGWPMCIVAKTSNNFTVQ